MYLYAKYMAFTVFVSTTVLQVIPLLHIKNSLNITIIHSKVIYCHIIETGCEPFYIL